MDIVNIAKHSVLHYWDESFKPEGLNKWNNYDEDSIFSASEVPKNYEISNMIHIVEHSAQM